MRIIAGRLISCHPLFHLQAPEATGTLSARFSPLLLWPHEYGGNARVRGRPMNMCMMARVDLRKIAYDFE